MSRKDRDKINSEAIAWGALIMAFIAVGVTILFGVLAIVFTHVWLISIFIILIIVIVVLILYAHYKI